VKVGPVNAVAHSVEMQKKVSATLNEHLFTCGTIQSINKAETRNARQILVTVSLAQFQENLSNGMALIRAWKPIGF
jgi:hypothetical protein